VNSIRTDVRTFIGGDLGRDVGSVADQESLLESGILDSMGVMSLVAFLEGKYRISIADDDMMPENFDTIDAIAAFVERQRSAG
jgi:acyl carrier protein